ncbi:hypothetical protein GOM49_13805 [Clostridium bovifaecis]|uniref:Lipoprotein n=1 Tax=Clostridium bovifaecis TaxID=2184719 RepID=A0A6I6EUI8_9CLOT|nr:hypothetical protein GOM49_13805 [Clostridium bovifaecis]
MAKHVKKFYRFLAWFFSVVIAAGTLIGCRGENKYGPPTSKYGPPTPSGYQDNVKENRVV